MNTYIEWPWHSRYALISPKVCIRINVLAQGQIYIVRKYQELLSFFI